MKTITITEDLDLLLENQQKANIRWFVDELYCHFPSQRNEIIRAIKDINEVGM